MNHSKIEQKIKKLGLKKTQNVAGMRRKKKINNPIQSTRLSQEERNFNTLIEKVNTNLGIVDDSYLDLVDSYINDWINDVIYNLKKKDLKDKTITIENLKENELYKFNFIETKERTKLKKNYSEIKKLFSEKGLRYFLNQIEFLNKNIERKDYIPKENDKDDIENIDIYYNRLEIEKGEIPTKDELKKQFLRLSSKYHPDKHPNEIEKYTKLFQDVNEAYKIILKYHYGSQNDHLYKN